MKYISVGLVIVLSVLGCSKAPENYGSTGYEEPPARPEQVNPTLTSLENPLLVTLNGESKPGVQAITDPLLGDEEVDGSAASDAKAKLNSQAPIIYEVGAGNITFQTTLDESELILTKPFNPPDSSGRTYYDGESMIVYWRTDEPRVPEAIFLLQGYLGKVSLPAPFAPVGMGYDFSNQYQKNTENGARSLARDYFRALTGAPAEFDCIAQNACVITWGQSTAKDFVFEIPGRMQWLISKDRFVVYAMLMFRQKDQGILDNNIDMLTGDFLIEGGNISFGQTYEEIENRLQINTYTSVGTDFYRREYDGINLAYQRSQFDRLITEPLPTDELKLVQVSQNYKKALTLGGMPIIVRESNSEVEVFRADAPGIIAATPEIQREVPLSIGLGLQKQNVMPFGKKLLQLLEDEFKAKYPTWQISSRFRGEHQIDQNKSYTGFVTAFEPVSNTGFYMEFSIGEEQGNLFGFFIMKLGGDLNPADTVIVEGIKTPIQKVAGEIEKISPISGQVVMDAQNKPVMVPGILPTYTVLSGFNIGGSVKITDWDLGRGEATAKIETATMQQVMGPSTKDIFTIPVTIQSRVNYQERGIEWVSFGKENIEPQSESFISIGSLSVVLGLKLVGQTESERSFKIASIASPMNISDIRGLCGGAIQPRFGMSDTEFLEKLRANPSCPVNVRYNTGLNGRISGAYFYEDRIALLFGAEELAAALIYAPVNEVN